MKKLMTLCLVCRDDEILLGMKKKGLGAGRWNGFGGKVEDGETVEAAAIRELREEVGLEAGEIKRVGVVEFSFENEPKLLEVHIFKTNSFSGDPIETDEMSPKWFKFNEIPYHQMWSDDEHWMPYLLEGKLFRGRFHFDRPSDAEYSAKILSKELTEVDTI